MKLRVFLPPAESPAPTERLAWMLFDARGELARADRTPVADMPRAETVEAVLPAERVLFARLKLPRVNSATIRDLLPYAVEDRLLGDPAHIHAVAGKRNARGETLVAVVDRAWLQAFLAMLSRHGLRVRRAWCESALLAGGRGDWHVVLGRASGMLVDDEGVSATFDRGEALPLTVRVALDEANGRGERPAQVVAHAAQDAALPDLARWSGEAGLAFTAGAPWEAIARGQPPADAIDLIRGDLGGEGESRWRVPRAAAILAGVVLALQVALTAADAFRLQREAGALQARREAIFREAFPEARVVVDPELQMARNLAELQRSRGLAAGDEFLAAMTRVARERGGRVASVEYANGKASVK